LTKLKARRLVRSMEIQLLRLIPFVVPRYKGNKHVTIIQLLPDILLMPAILFVPSIQLLPVPSTLHFLSTIIVPGFPFSSHLIVPVEVARVEEVGLLRIVVLVLLAIEVAAVKRILGSCNQGVRHQSRVSSKLCPIQRSSIVIAKHLSRLDG